MSEIAFTPPEAQSPQLLEAITTLDHGQRLSCLPPTSVADYLMSATALQLDGQEVFLDPIVRENAEAHVARAHHEMVVGACDAITTELIPNRSAYTNISSHSVAETPAMRQLMQDERFQPYLALAPESLPDNMQPEQIGEDAVRLLIGMRQAICTYKDTSPETTYLVAQDLCDAAKIIFDEVRKSDAEELTDEEDGRHKELVLSTAWSDFTDITKNLVKALQDDGDSQALIAGSIFLNATHAGIASEAASAPGEFKAGSILEKFANSYEEIGHYAAALDAGQSSNSYNELARLGSYLSVSLWPYLTGKRKSLSGLRGQQVPAQFTQLGG